jgi:hypothetical protein
MQHGPPKLWLPTTLLDPEDHDLNLRRRENLKFRNCGTSVHFSLKPNVTLCILIVLVLKTFCLKSCFICIYPWPIIIPIGGKLQMDVLKFCDTIGNVSVD